MMYIQYSCMKFSKKMRIKKKTCVQKDKVLMTGMCMQGRGRYQNNLDDIGKGKENKVTGRKSFSRNKKTIILIDFIVVVSQGKDWISVKEFGSRNNYSLVSI